MIEDSEIERAMAIAAHPDDIDFGCSGTVATWINAGIDVTYCVITDGDAGGFDPDVPRSQIPGIRRREQLAAAACIGVTDVRFLGYKDGELAVSHGLRRDISRIIRQVRPQRIVVPSPQRNYESIYASHPDHLAAGEASLQAIYPDARNPFAHPALLHDENLEAWVVPETWIMGMSDFNHYVDITDVFGQKFAALKAHVSQTEHMTELETMLRTRDSTRAELAGFPAGHLAEAFRVLNTA